MIAKAGQIIAIDSVKVDNTLSGDGVRTPLGVKATAPAVSGHAGLSAEKVDNTVYIGMEPGAVKVVSTNESVSIEKTVKSDGTVEYNLGVSDTKIIGSNGISARETAPATYTIGVSGDYVKSETLNDYYTKDDANATFQPKGDYVEESEIQDMATETWVGEHYVPKNVLESYYTKDEVYNKNETYSKDEVYTKQEVNDLIPDTSNFALSADVDTAINEAADDISDWVEHNFQEIGDYASTSDVETASANAYDKAVAKIPDVTNFITKDVNNLTYYYDKTETSSTSEITNALSTKLDSTVAEQTYQPIGNYATTSDINDMATQTWVGQQGYLTSIPNTYALKSDVEAASANAYDKAVAKIPNVDNFITKDVNDLTYYYKKTETSGSTELSTEFAKKVNNPDTSLTDKYLVLRTDTNGAVSGWCNFNDKIYSKSESDGRYMQKNTDSTLSGDGTTNSPLGIDSDNFYELDTAGNYLASQTSNQKTIISTTPALDNAISRVSTSADVWDTVSAKSTVTVNTTNNEIKVNNNANSAISAVSYDLCEVGEPDLIPQKMIVGTSSGAFVSYVTGGKCNGMGTLFFWLESQQPWNPVNE